MLGLLVYGVYDAFAILRYGAQSFAFVSASQLHQSHASPTIDRYAHVTSHGGYDGQYYLFIALDPRNAWHYLDRPAYRYTHIVYPILARIVALGRPSAIPYALIAVNVVAVVTGGVIVAAYLARRGRSPWLACLYLFFPGIAEASSMDLGEPVAFALVAVGVWLVTESRASRRLLLATVAFALAGLDREISLLVPLTLGAAGLLGFRPLGAERRRDLALLVTGSLAPFVAWWTTTHVWLPEKLSNAPSLPAFPLGTWPYQGLIFSSGRDALADASVGFAGTVLLVACLVALRRDRRDGMLLALAVVLVANVVFLNDQSYGQYFSAGRIQAGAVFLALLSIDALARTPIVARLTRVALCVGFLPLPVLLVNLGLNGLKPL